MTAHIHADKVTADLLRDLVARLRSQAPHTILERVSDIDFPAPDEDWDPTNWDEGRIFGPSLELHWARQDGGFRAVLTREDEGKGTDLPLLEVLDESEYERQEYAYYLWGEQDTRIGREIAYRSVPGKGRAQLVAAEFYDKSGELYHWRYVCFRREGI